MNFAEYEAKCLSEDIGLDMEMEETALAVERPIEVIEGEILFYKQVAGGAVLEIGRRLMEAKEQLRHGEWESWLEEKVGFSVRSAQRYMKLAKGHGESDTVSLLGTRKALVLLGLEDSERSEFLEENNAENMTVRELEEAIRERNEARLAAEQAQADAQVAKAGKDKLEAEMVLANSRIQAADKEAEKLRAQIKKLESRPVEVAVQVDEKAVAAARAEGELKGRKDAQKEAEEAAGKVEKAMKDRRQRLERAEKESREAKEDAQQLQKKLEAAGKQSKLGGSAELVEFNAHFRIAQEQVEEMAAIIRSLRSGGDTGLAEKLCRAMGALANMIGEQTEG